MSADSESSRDWGNVRFRPRVAGPSKGTDQSDGCVKLAVIVFVAVALAYPWYSYWVHAHLLSRDMQAAAVEFNKQARALESAASTPWQTLSALSDVPVARAVSTPIRLMGISEGTSGAVLVAELGDSSLADARDSLCFQASRWSGRSSSGRAFRVQRYRGNAPAVHAGSIQC